MRKDLLPLLLICRYGLGVAPGGLLRHGPAVQTHGKASIAGCQLRPALMVGAGEVIKKTRYPGSDSGFFGRRRMASVGIYKSTGRRA
jgi:hypothetical protein